MALSRLDPAYDAQNRKHMKSMQMIMSQTLKSQLSKPALSAKTFKFDASEFKKKVPFRTVEMESGAVLTAPSDQFDKVFDVTSKSNGDVEYTTRGRVADQRMLGR